MASSGTSEVTPLTFRDLQIVKSQRVWEVDFFVLNGKEGFLNCFPWRCSGAVACLYLEHLLEESWEEIRKLRGSMYSYKAN